MAALLYYLLSGTDAFEGPTLLAIIARHTQGNPRPLADVIPGGHVPHELALLLETWMAREAGVRPANAWDALSELEPLAIRSPWSQRDSRATAGGLGQASTEIVHAGMVATRYPAPSTRTSTYLLTEPSRSEVGQQSCRCGRKPGNHCHNADPATAC